MQNKAYLWPVARQSPRPSCARHARQYQESVWATAEDCFGVGRELAHGQAWDMAAHWGWHVIGRKPRPSGDLSVLWLRMGRGMPGSGGGIGDGLAGRCLVVGGWVMVALAIIQHLNDNYCMGIGIQVFGYSRIWVFGYYLVRYWGIGLLNY